MFYNKLNEESEDVNDIIILNDEEGLEIQFQFLDLIEYSGRDFVVTLPIDTYDNQNVIIFELFDNNDDPNTEEYVIVQDDNILEIVYAIFKHKFKDQFDFLD